MQSLINRVSGQDGCPLFLYQKESFFVSSKFQTNSFDQIAWTEPYIFTDGDIGFTIVKLMMDGDWNETKQTGVWAADYTVEFINNFINTFDLQENSIVYIMDDEGNLMAASSGITVKTTGTVGGNVDEEFTHAREVCTLFLPFKHRYRMRIMRKLCKKHKLSCAYFFVFL